MAHPQTSEEMPEAGAPSSPSAEEVCAYVEEMAIDLAAMASRTGETQLAASLALIGIQANAARRRHGGG